MAWNFLTVEDVERIHDEMLLLGGLEGLRDHGLLESAVIRPQQTAEYLEGASAADLAASLGYGVIKNRAFLDANKRTGLASVVIFLRANGYRLLATTAEKVRAVEDVASGQMSESEWTAWISERLERLS